jgi:hypothetical protein
MIGSGALHTKFFFKHPNLCRQTYWDLKHVVREVLTGTNLFLPDIGFSHCDKLRCTVRGALRYFLMRKEGALPIHLGASDRAGFTEIRQRAA